MNNTLEYPFPQTVGRMAGLMGSLMGKGVQIVQWVKALSRAGLPIPRTDGSLAALKSIPDKEIKVQTGWYVPRSSEFAPVTGPCS